MHRPLQTFCLAAAMAACAPAWADLVTVAATGPNVGFNFSVTFNDADNDKELTFAEVQSFSGFTLNGVTFDVLLQTAAVPTGSSSGQLPSGYSIVGSDATGTTFCFPASYWCYSDLDGSDLSNIRADANSAFTYTVSVTSVPEPGSLALLGVALAGLTLTRRRGGTAAQQALQAA